MKLLIRAILTVTLIIGLMGATQAQDDNATVDDFTDNAVTAIPSPPPEVEAIPEVPQATPKVADTQADKVFDIENIDWLTLLAGGGIALLLAQFIGLLKSRRESHRELQQWFTKWSVEECVEPLLAYLEAINLHFATSRASNMQVDAVPPIPIAAFHRLRVITNSTSIAHIILVLENWSKHKVSTEEYDEVTGLITKFRSYLLELEGYLLETSINERSDILELRHKKEVVNSLTYLNSLKKEMQTIGTKYRPHGTDL